MSKWTKKQFSIAMDQIEETEGLEGFLDYSESATVDAILDVFCERNALLDALRIAQGGVSKWRIVKYVPVEGK